MRLFIIGTVLGIGTISAWCQTQMDPAKLAQVYKIQRDSNADALAQCAVTNQDLAARIAELEKKLAESEAKNAETPK